MVRKIRFLLDTSRPAVFQTFPQSSLFTFFYFQEWLWNLWAKCFITFFFLIFSQRKQVPVLPYFLTAVHCTASMFLSHCSERSTLLQTWPCLLLGTKELITLKHLIMKESCSRRLENKTHFSIAPFYWLVSSFSSCSLLLYLPHTC